MNVNVKVNRAAAIRGGHSVWGWTTVSVDEAFLGSLTVEGRELLAERVRGGHSDEPKGDCWSRELMRPGPEGLRESIAEVLAEEAAKDAQRKARQEAAFAKWRTLPIEAAYRAGTEYSSDVDGVTIPTEVLAERLGELRAQRASQRAADLTLIEHVTDARLKEAIMVAASAYNEREVLKLSKDGEVSRYVILRAPEHNTELGRALERSGEHPMIRKRIVHLAGLVEAERLAEEAALEAADEALLVGLRTYATQRWPERFARAAEDGYAVERDAFEFFLGELIDSFNGLHGPTGYKIGRELHPTIALPVPDTVTVEERSRAPEPAAFEALDHIRARIASAGAPPAITVEVSRIGRMKLYEQAADEDEGDRDEDGEVARWRTGFTVEVKCDVLDLASLIVVLTPAEMAAHLPRRPDRFST